MNWDDLRFFLCVARAGRISIAAKQLGVEHTTVGRRLAALEAALGVPLFYRTAAGYRLTPHGERALDDAQAMERAALALGGHAREGAAAPRGRVRLALLDEVASHWLAPHLPAFAARHPQIELRVLTGIAQLDLSRGEAELAVRSPRPRQAGLAAVRLARTTTGLYASRKLLAGRRLRVQDASALAYPLLLYLPQFRPLQSAAWFQPVMASARVALTTNSTHTLLAAARAGAGIAVLPRLVARGYRELVAVSDDTGADGLWLVTHPEYRRDPNVRTVAEFLRQRAKGPGGIV